MLEEAKRCGITCNIDYFIYAYTVNKMEIIFLDKDPKYS
jgi:hypothetical protein